MQVRSRVVVALAALALAGCGGDDGADSIGGEVHGQVRDSHGSPAEGIWVGIGERRYLTPTSGRYRFAPVRPGEHSVAIGRDVAGFICTTETFTLHPGESVTLNIDLPPECPPK